MIEKQREGGTGEGESVKKIYTFNFKFFILFPLYFILVNCMTRVTWMVEFIGDNKAAYFLGVTVIYIILVFTVCTKVTKVVIHGIDG